MLICIIPERHPAITEHDSVSPEASFALKNYLNDLDRVEALVVTGVSGAGEEKKDGDFILVDGSVTLEQAGAASMEKAADKVDEGFVLVDDHEQGQLQSLKKYMAALTCSNMVEKVKKDIWE